MGENLRLARVLTIPPQHGGHSGGDGYDAAVRRVYRDRRQTAESRELILLLLWLATRDPDRFSDDGTLRSPWKRAAVILEGTKKGRRGASRLGDLLLADLPRYEADKATREWMDQRCKAPMVRRPGKCGRQAVGHLVVSDPKTGWHSPAWHCRRHISWAEGAAATDGPRPEPIPNRGGLLPSYFRQPFSDDGWISVYRSTAEWASETWKKSAYGICADRWPTPGRVMQETPVRLRLVASDGFLVAPGGLAAL